MKHPDTLIGVLLLGFCTVIFSLTTSFPEVPAMLSQNVPPTFFPRLIISVIATLSIALIFNGLQKTAHVTERVQPAVFVTTAIIIVAGVMVSLIGTLLTLALVAVAIPFAWGERRLRPIGILAVTLPAGIYLVFSLALGIRFPGGLLFGWMT